MKKYIALCLLLLSSLSYSCRKGEADGIRKYAGILAGDAQGYFTLHFESGNSRASVVYDGETYEGTNNKTFGGNMDGETVEFVIGELLLVASFNASPSPSILVEISGYETVAVSMHEETENAPVSIYMGQGNSTYMDDYVNHDYVLYLVHGENDYYMYETVTASSNPMEDDAGATIGNGGTFTETESAVVFNVENGVLTFAKQDNLLVINETGTDNYSLQISLSKVN